MVKMAQDLWDMVIGLEIHVQVNGKTKAFCGDKNEFTTEPNIHLSPFTLAHPGTLPRVNTYHIESAVKLGLAFGSQVNKVSYFDRKNYFYPDLPKGYQITQDNQPICVGGAFQFPMPDGQIKTVRIHHLHMEEDAGKSIHDQNEDHTLLDYNRAGVPLIEIVTEPDLRSSNEVYAFIQYMQILVRSLQISDGNMEEGSFRCDCNVSVKPQSSTQLGTRCEIKNLNSKRFAKLAVDYESSRQIRILEKGGKILQNTMLFDPQTGSTYVMRDKEEVNDYRYFNDPDIPPIKLSDDLIEELKSQLVSSPIKNYTYLANDYDLKHDEIETLIERNDMMRLLRLCEAIGSDKREVALLLINKVIPEWENLGIDKLKEEKIAEKIDDFIKIYLDNKISKSLAYRSLFDKIWIKPDVSILQIAEENNLLHSNNVEELEVLIDKIITKNPDKVLAYKNGKKGLLGFFMGEGMKASKGKFDPKILNKMMVEKLNSN